jgi:hypothetical protein
VDRFTDRFSERRTEAAISILMFYAGASLKRAPAAAPPARRRKIG